MDPKHTLVEIPNPETDLFGKTRQMHESGYHLDGRSRYVGPREMNRSLAGLDGSEGSLSRGGRRRDLAVARALRGAAVSS